MKTLILLIFSSALLSLSVLSQTAPQFEIRQSVIANGGGFSEGTSNGRTFGVTSTQAEAVAGVNSTGPGFGVRGGFWQFFLGPTAAHVSISGRVMALNGRPVSRAVVQILDASGVQRSVFTNVFGRFRFEGIEAGQTYIVDVRHRTLRFAPSIVSANDNIIDLEVVELP